MHSYKGKLFIIRSTILFWSIGHFSAICTMRRRDITLLLTISPPLSCYSKFPCNFHNFHNSFSLIWELYAQSLCLYNARSFSTEMKSPLVLLLPFRPRANIVYSDFSIWIIHWNCSPTTMMMEMDTHKNTTPEIYTYMCSHEFRSNVRQFFTIPLICVAPCHLYNRK